MILKKMPTWIWTQNCESLVNQYAEFIREFEIFDVSDARLAISCDTNFAAWVNGQFVGCGQFWDFPGNKTFSQMDMSGVLKPGKNVLAILVHYCGANHFTYIPGQAGLWYSLQTAKDCILSDSQTLCRLSSSYLSENCARLSVMMGYTFNYDTAGDDGWRFTDYVPGADWQAAASCKEQNVPQIRPLPMLEYKSRPVVRVIAQGFLKRYADAGVTVADSMQRDFLSALRSWELFGNIEHNEDIINRPISIATWKIADADGFYVIYDMGREECGLIDVELIAAADTVVDIAVGEHLDDLRVRAAHGGKNFASRLVTRDGLNCFTHYTNRYTGRYVQLHVTKITSDVTLNYAGLLPTEYPIKMRGEFASADSLEKQIFEISRRTMHLCMHEHYEDCPWREQALYANDSRNQALAGYYAFGEYDFPRVCFDLLKQSFSSDGYQELCAPMRFDFTIPSFTMAWYLAVEDYVRYSGDLEYAQQKLPTIKCMIDAYNTTLTDNLLPCPTGKRYWQFYDWADGLDGVSVHPSNGGLTGQRFDATLNFWYVLALQAAAKIAQTCGDVTAMNSYNAQADATAKVSHAFFWDKNAAAYKTYIGEQAIENHFAELTQSLALLCGGCDSARAASLRAKLANDDNGMVKTTLSQSLYKFEALLQDAPIFGKNVFDKIRDDWGMMLFSGATSFWETIRGSWDFDCAGSMCHGWSGIPAYFYGAYALGIKPLDNGFKTFAISPLTTAFERVSGKVPTPYGDIEVQWDKCGDSVYFEIMYPKQIVPKFINFASHDKISAKTF